jgi:hypothetical protein
VSRTFPIITALADAQALLEQYGAGCDVGTGFHLEVVIGCRKAHAWLKHHEGGHGGEQAVGIRISLHAR